MYPTPDDFLASIGRLVEQGAGGSHDDAARLVRRLQRSWPLRHRFLVEDNQLGLDLIIGLSELAPALADEIATVTMPAVWIDERSAHDINNRIQDLIARAVHELPDSDEGDAARARIARHLRLRIRANPALNREPLERSKELV